MTNQPQMTVEAEALAFAREWIADCLAGDWLSLGVSMLHPEAGRVLLRQILKHLAMSHPFKMAEIISDARAGWDEADLAMRELIAELTDRGERLPAQLAAYLIEAVHPNLPRPRGRKRASNILQDITIVALTNDMIERFPTLRATRNSLSRRNASVSSLVAIALNEARIGRSLTNKAVEAVCARYLPAVGFYKNPQFSIT